MTKTLALASALLLSLSACGAVGGMVAVSPVEAIVAAEAGYPSYFEQGLDYLAGQFCENPRDPVTGNCN